MWLSRIEIHVVNSSVKEQNQDSYLPDEESGRIKPSFSKNIKSLEEFSVASSEESFEITGLDFQLIQAPRSSPSRCIWRAEQGNMQKDTMDPQGGANEVIMALLITAPSPSGT